MHVRPVERPDAAEWLKMRHALFGGEEAEHDREIALFFSGERFAPLRAKGARVQRLLWASTGTKDPAYSDLLYVEPLLGPDTVNTYSVTVTKDGEDTGIRTKGRHDPCVVPRAVPIVEAMAALVLGDFALRQKKLILAESHPEWSPEQVANEARRLVFGVSQDSFS